MNYVVKTSKPEIFLNIFLLFLEILIIIRTIMVSLNVFYFSKDIENVLHLPIKPIEILISKFSTILFMNYEVELLFAVIPIFTYGLYTYAGISYFLNSFVLILTFPFYSTLIVSIIMIFLMKTIKLFKNKDLMQIIISFILIFGIMLVSQKALEYVFNNTEFIENNQELFLTNVNNKINKINNYFFNINPSINILLKKGLFSKLLDYLKLTILNFIAFILFIIIGNKLYLKQLLNANFYSKSKKNETIRINNKSKRNKISYSYIKKEFKLLLKNPLFFIQCVYPVIIMTIFICILISTLVPTVNEMLHKEEYKEVLENLKFDIEIVCYILGATQIIGLFNYSSITSFSREGQNAYINKMLPINLYKQFLYKNVPQITTNIISSAIFLSVINYKIPEIGIIYILVIFGLSVLLTIINSFILCLIDLLMPRLNWNAEYDILKNNKNKLLQYALIIFNILFLVFINYLFKRYNLNISLCAFACILAFLVIIFNLLISKNINRLFRNIK